MCWVHAALTIAFLHGLNLPLDDFVKVGIDDNIALALAGLIPLVTGIVLGSLMQGSSKPKSA